jgi:hypothetical protein
MITFETRTNLLWSGENPIILLKPSADKPEYLAVGFFRVDFSDSGTGHAVFISGDLGGAGRKEDRVFACYTDRTKVAQWILANTITTLPEFKNHDLRQIPIKAGRFAWVGDTRSSWTELISSDDGEIRLTWADLQPPFNLRVPIGAVPTIPYEINTIIYPAGRAEVIVNGRTAVGKPFPDQIGNQPHSTAFLALSETWYRPSK